MSLHANISFFAPPDHREKVSSRAIWPVGATIKTVDSDSNKPYVFTTSHGSDELLKERPVEDEELENQPHIYFDKDAGIKFKGFTAECILECRRSEFTLPHPSVTMPRIPNR